MDWSGTVIEENIPITLHLSKNEAESQTNYTWQINEQEITSTALILDSSIYFDNLEVNLPHNSYHEQIPTQLEYQLLSSDVELASFGNTNYLIGTVESYIPYWNEQGMPLQFILTKESTTTENGIALSQEVLQALATQEDHFIKLYPNPFVSDLIIAYTLETTSNIQIQVSSFDGTQNYTVAQAQRQEAGDYRYHFEGANLTKGVYIVNVFVDGEKKTKLIIKK